MILKKFHIFQNLEIFRIIWIVTAINIYTNVSTQAMYVFALFPNIALQYNIQVKKEPRLIFKKICLDFILLLDNFPK